MKVARDISSVKSNVMVVVSENEIRITHPDLQAKIWVTPEEIPNNKIDNDNDGCVDDVNGWSFANNVKPNTILNLGTHAAGLVAANTNNGIDISAMNVVGGTMNMTSGINSILNTNDTGSNIINCS